ncbi:MAG TPA: potassium/proton antiporter [Actinomycetes bacterium]|nr:potassium/proton antiporter [Actinomycetes bacterium]
MNVELLGVLLLVGSVVLLVAITAVRLAVGSGLPTLLLYLALGIVLGDDSLGFGFDDPELARALGYAALVVILAEGGLTTPWSSIRTVVPAAASLAVVGTAASVGVVAVAAHTVLDIGWQQAILIGAVLSPTDSAAVFSVLRRVPLPPRLGGLLEAESGFNDAPAVILVVALAGASAPSWWELLLLIGYELAVGAVVGLAVGFAGAWGVRRIALPASGLYPIAVLALCTAAYGAAAVIHASGFLAVYLTGLVLGNSRLPHRPATRGFAEGMAWLAQIGLFVMLGLVATPSELGPSILPALAIGVVLLVVARPVSVVVALGPFGTRADTGLSTAALDGDDGRRVRWRLPTTWRERGLLSWAGLRGAVPVVLATASADDDIFNLVFVLVVVFTLVQAPTLPAVARRLRVVAEDAAQPLDIESSPLTRLEADLLQVHVPAGSRLAGVEVTELSLPDGAAVTLVVRDGQAFVPRPSTTLRVGDDLILVATDSARSDVERRLRAVSVGGRLADWHAPRRRPGRRT